MLAGRIRARTIVIPAMAAALCAGVAAYWEISVIAGAEGDCEIGINASADFLVLLFWLPVLWLLQTAVVAVPAPFLALVSRSRLVVAGLMVLLAIVLLAVAAWVVLAAAGLPIQGSVCASPHPLWWPRWLPPAAGYPF